MTSLPDVHSSTWATQSDITRLYFTHLNMVLLSLTTLYNSSRGEAHTDTGTAKSQ